MNRNYKIITIFSFLLLLIVGCSSNGNPFVGYWASGAVNLEFKSSKTFQLSIGKTLLVNLEGTYKYDKETLTLNVEGDNKIPFSYELKDGDKRLVLKPESESGYIDTKMEFTRQ